MNPRCAFLRALLVTLCFKVGGGTGGCARTFLGGGSTPAQACACSAAIQKCGSAGGLPSLYFSRNPYFVYWDAAAAATAAVAVAAAANLQQVGREKAWT
jgi:hypothetical protein